MTDSSGSSTTYVYNPITGTPALGAGQLLSEHNSFLNCTITYAYDELGRRTSQSIDGATESVVYDALGRVTSDINLLGTFTPTYQLGAQASFRAGSVSLPNGLTTTFNFDNAAGDQRLLEIKNTLTGTVVSKSDYQYDALSRIKQWTQQSGVGTPSVRSFEYDYEGEMVNETISPQGQAYTYGYDSAGNRTNEEIDVASPAQATVTTSSYDDVNELTTRIGKGTTGTLPVRFIGTIDKAGTTTILPQGGSAGPQNATITVNPASPSGRVFEGIANLSLGANTVAVTATDLQGDTTTKNYSLTVAGGVPKTYGYDNNGNTISSGTATYTWDAADRLLSIVDSGSGKTTQFTYDGLGRRVQIRDQSGSTVTTKRFVWVGAQLAQERAGNNSVNKSFFAGGERIGAQNYYFTRDHLGSVREMTDHTGSVVVRYDYDPYGRQTQLAGSLSSDFGFAGYYVHAPSGLNLTLFRAYDPDSGRWLNQDPIGEAGGLNLYGFVGNDPINEIDPLGLADNSDGDDSLDRMLNRLDSGNYTQGGDRWTPQEAQQAANDAKGVGVDAAMILASAATGGAPELAELKGVPGTYKVCLNNGKSYVGKAVDIAKRLAQHVKAGKWKWNDIKAIFAEPANTEKLRRIREAQRLMEETGGVHPSQAPNVLNKIMPPKP
jgi:RHS repeat-associated protein